MAFYDFNLTSNARGTIFTPATFWPYWDGIIPNEVLASEEVAKQAFSSVRLVMARYNGTLPASFLVSGLQWDAPKSVNLVSPQDEFRSGIDGCCVAPGLPINLLHSKHWGRYLLIWQLLFWHRSRKPPPRIPLSHRTSSVSTNLNYLLSHMLPEDSLLVILMKLTATLEETTLEFLEGQRSSMVGTWPLVRIGRALLVGNWQTDTFPVYFVHGEYLLHSFRLSMFHAFLL